MISNIRLQNYRSYLDQSFEFDDGVNVIVGPNASGKTNLLEALIFVARGGSFRGKDENIIMTDQPWMRIDSFTANGATVVKLKQEPQRTTKQFEVNKEAYVRLPKKYRLPLVVFEPNHLQLLHGSPDGRREFMDETVAGYDSVHSTVVNQYKRALAQRNALLKTKKHSDQLFVWDIRLSELGEKIAKNRMELVDSVNRLISEVYSEIACKKTIITLRYDSKCDQGQYGSSLLKMLEKQQDNDYERGFTTVGVHRDDLLVHIDGMGAGLAASRGETRSIILALKIIELEGLRTKSQKAPMFLLDDVYSELDGGRRHALTDYIGNNQVFITTTDADILMKNFTNKCRIIAPYSKD